MSNNFTFEQLCIRNEKGYAFDLGTIFMPSNPNSFDDVVFKLISKIDTSLLLLGTHDVQVENFTIIAIPLSSSQDIQNQSDVRTYQGKKFKLPTAKSSALNLTILQNVWDCLDGEGWHGLQSLALLTPESIPDIGARKYSLYQYTTCIMDVIRANYMFQKYKDAFHHETLDVFDEADTQGATQTVIGLLWKSSLKERRIPVVTVRRRPGVPILNSSSSSLHRTMITPVKLRRQNRKQSVQTPISFEDEDEEEEEEEEEDEMEVDEEISFKNPLLYIQTERTERPRPVIEDILQIPTSPRGRRSASPKSIPPAPTPQPLPPAAADIPLGFETSVNVPKGSRKSMMGRKSLSSDWPEEERQAILDVYDNLNPNVPEQKRIALTCKYVSLLMDKELPSKLLYQWIQKKGRIINKTVNTFNTPVGDEQKEVALKCFRELNEECSETARVSFTLKLLDVQYGLTVSSKQLYTWLNEKPSTKKPARRR